MNFYISSSRFIAVFFGLIAVIAFAGGVAGFVKGRYYKTGNAVIRDYQYEKMQAVPGVEIAFFGDSSLGNAVDAAYFSELSGMKAANFALSGSFGFGGPLNLLRRARETYGRALHTAVFVITPDMLRRELSTDGYMLTVPGAAYVWDDYGRKAPAKAVEYTATSILHPGNVMTLWRILRGSVETYKISDLAAHDYIAQGQANIKIPEQPWAPQEITAEKTFLLERAGDYCRRQNMRCIFMYGPLLEDIVDKNGAYFEAAERLIKSRADGITPVLAPWKMKREDMGNTTDHVKPGAKRDYTRQAYKKLKGFL